MSWLKQQIVLIVTLGSLLAGIAATWGRMQIMVSQIDRKADKEVVAAADLANRELVAAGQTAIMRELDSVQRKLQEIDTRLDAITQQKAIITDVK